MSTSSNADGKLTTRPGWPAAVAAVLISGVRFYLSTGIVPCTVAAWIAPVPLLIVLVDLTWGEAALAALCAHALGDLGFVVRFAWLCLTAAIGSALIAIRRADVPLF